MRRAPSPYFTGLRPVAREPAASARKPLVRGTLLPVDPVRLTPAVVALAALVRLTDAPSPRGCSSPCCLRRPREGHAECDTCASAGKASMRGRSARAELAAAGWLRTPAGKWRDPVPPHTPLRMRDAIVIVRRDARRGAA